MAWRVTIPSEQLGLEVTTPLADQELSTDNSSGITYWEGAIQLSGTRDGKPSTGVGYLEMTGYAKPRVPPTR